MSLLLDTHAALWFFQADSRLPASTRERIEDAGLAAHVSVASLWEIAIKVSLHKLTLPGEFETLFPSSVPQSGLTLLPIAVAHIAAVRRLEHHPPRPVRSPAHRPGEDRRPDAGLVRSALSGLRRAAAVVAFLSVPGNPGQRREP